MRAIKYFGTCVVLLLTCISTYAQQRSSGGMSLYDGGVKVASAELSCRFDSLYIKINFAIEDLALRRRQSVVLTPVIVGAQNVVELPNVMIMGGNSYKSTKRNVALSGKEGREAFAEVIMLKNPKAATTLIYEETIPYMSWMRRGTLELQHDLCGCNGAVITEGVRMLAKMAPARGVVPRVAYVKPQEEAVKTRTTMGSAFLNFPVNEIAISPEYMDNSMELAKIMHTIGVVKSDPNTRITHINIHGYASPEGLYANNARLAEERAQALRSYLLRFSDLGNVVFSVTSTPEDWMGLKKMVEAYPDMQNRQKVLDIINSSDEPDRKNYLLRLLSGGETYRFMLKEFYPSLRRVDYEVVYLVQGFDAEQAKQVIKVTPAQLSLNEMYMVANTYEQGSVEFNEVFEMAVKMFPDDTVANNNAAATALSRGDVESAAIYLARIVHGSSAGFNNMGVLYFMQENYDEAERAFKAAKAAGSVEASENLSELFME